MPIILGNHIKSMMLGTRPVKRAFLGTLQVWAAEVISVLGNDTDVILDSLFSAADWNNHLVPKRVVVPVAVEIGATSYGFAIATTVTANSQAESFAGDLTLDIFGIVSGLGGPANSGNGGDALWAKFLGRQGQKLKVNVMPGGDVRSGGGGGGRAGNGGGGQYNYTYREPSSGWQANTSGYGWNWDSDNSYFRVHWGHSLNHVATASQSATSVSAGGWLYLKGPVRVRQNCDIARQQTRTQNTDGGIANSAGRGQGHGSARTSGAAPVAGGTNAGASGRSGDGGDWGQNGNAGASGASGNRSGGLAGATGGLAGAAIKGVANIDLTNQGSVRGRII